MKVANGIEMLEVQTQNMMGEPRVVYPTLVWDDRDAILVDTGFPGQMAQLRSAVAQTGEPFERINRIILTHQDIDHIGNLATIQRERPGQVRVMAHAKEVPYIQGEKPPHKLTGLETRLSTEPELRTMYERLTAGFKMSFGPVDEPLADGEELPYCGGIRVIYTPGHTIGHICLYLRPSKTLIAGDLLTVEEGKLNRMQAAINFDDRQAGESVKKLAGFDVDTVICYHGGLYRGDANVRIAKLAA